jgi:hypothetical protein
MSVIGTEHAAKFRAMHVGMSMLLEVEFPTGTKRYHNGAGTAFVGGLEWEGVTDAYGSNAVVVQEIDYPEYGTAPTMGIVLVGCDTAFMRYIFEDADELEGAECTLYIVVLDQETLEELIPLTAIFLGRLTAAKPFWQGIGVRTVLITGESIWQAGNFPFDGIWSAIGHERLHPGDKGGANFGVKATGIWK